MKHGVHLPGEGGWGIAKAKWLVGKLEVLAATGGEGRFGTVTWEEGHLSVSLLQIQCSTPLGAQEGVEGVVHVREGCGVLFGDVAQPTVMHTELDGVILFLYEN